MVLVLNTVHICADVPRIIDVGVDSTGNGVERLNRWLEEEGVKPLDTNEPMWTLMLPEEDQSDERTIAAAKAAEMIASANSGGDEQTFGSVPKRRVHRRNAPSDDGPQSFPESANPTTAHAPVEGGHTTKVAAPVVGAAASDDDDVIVVPLYPSAGTEVPRKMQAEHEAPTGQVQVELEVQTQMQTDEKEAIVALSSDGGQQADGAKHTHTQQQQQQQQRALSDGQLQDQARPQDQALSPGASHAPEAWVAVSNGASGSGGSSGTGLMGSHNGTGAAGGGGNGNSAGTDQMQPMSWPPNVEGVATDATHFLFVVEKDHSSLTELEARLLACNLADPAPAMAGSPSVPPTELAMTIGRSGEACAAEWLQSQARAGSMPQCFNDAGGGGGEWEIQWDNMTEEFGNPWDIRCIRKGVRGDAEDRVVYIEVKATSRHDRAAIGEFEISGREIVQAKKHQANYIIMRMCGIPINQASGQLALYFFLDPWEMLTQTTATLKMHVPMSQ